MRLHGALHQLRNASGRIDLALFNAVTGEEGGFTILNVTKLLNLK